MTPGARIAAAIEILDRVIAGASADRSLAEWGRRHRFAGSGDRRGIADLVYDALRRRRSLGWRLGESGRGLMLALAAETGQLALFSTAHHSPPPPSMAETAALAMVGPPEASVALDCPPSLMAALNASLGSRFVPVLQALQARAEVYLRVNRLKTDPEAARLLLAKDAIDAVPMAQEADALRVVSGRRRLHLSQAMEAGMIEIQDLSSQRAARFAAAAPGETVLDFCAGGGGKTLALAAHMQGRGRLFAHDAAPQRLRELERRARRAGAGVALLSLDAPPRPHDLVFVDAPCSGSGAWHRNPDAKWRLDTASLSAFLDRQDTVLSAAAPHVRPGGRLVYATCSLLAQENTDRIAAFLARQPAFSAGPVLALTPDGPGDGFYAAWLQRSSSG